MLRDWLRREGFDVGRRHVRTLMRRMGIHALYRRPRTTILEPKAAIYPYLLKDLCIERPNQVWATDITYIPLAKGSPYLVAILDLATRRAMAWRLSNTMSTDFCIEALNEAITRYGAPEIFNTATKVANSPLAPSPMCSKPTMSRSAWMARAAGSTMSSWNGFGEASSTRMSI